MRIEKEGTILERDGIGFVKESECNEDDKDKDDDSYWKRSNERENFRY